MKKNMIIIGSIIIASLLMVACGHGGGGMVYMGEEKQADNRMKKIVKAINEEDSEAMKAMFSSKAQEESEELDQEIEDLFSFIEGDINKWEQESWGAGDSIRHGKKRTQLRSWYIVETEQEVYGFFILDYTKDTIEPENEGLYTIHVWVKSREDEEAEKFHGWQTMVIPGIYTPDYEEY